MAISTSRTTAVVTAGLLAVVLLAQGGRAHAGGFVCCGPPSSFASVSIEKLVNGEDADTAPGVIVPVGSAVTFTYRVTNTGTVPLFPADFIVVDDNGTPAVAGDDFSPTRIIGDASLDVGETWTYSEAQTALPGLHTNVGAVLVPGAIIIGPPGGIEPADVSFTIVLASDPANYTGVPAPASLLLVGSALAGVFFLTRPRRHLPRLRW